MAFIIMNLLVGLTINKIEELSKTGQKIQALKRVEDIVDRSVQFQDSEILEDWEDLLDVHTLLEEIA